MCGWHRACAEPVLAAPVPAALAAFRAGRWGSPNADQQRNPPRPVPLDPGSGTGTGVSTDLSPAEARYTHPHDEPPPRRHWVCSGPGKQVFLLRNVSPPPGLAAASFPAFGASLCSFRFVQFPTSQVQTLSPRTGAPLPFPHPSGLLGASCVRCGAGAPQFLRSRLETKLPPGEPAGPATGSASPRLRPPLLALAHAQGSLPVAISPGLLLPSFSFGPLKK